MTLSQIVVSDLVGGDQNEAIEHADQKYGAGLQNHGHAVNQGNTLRQSDEYEIEFKSAFSEAEHDQGQKRADSQIDPNQQQDKLVGARCMKQGWRIPDSQQQDADDQTDTGADRQMNGGSFPAGHDQLG